MDRHWICRSVSDILLLFVCRYSTLRTTDGQSHDRWVTSVDLPVELQGTHALYNMSLSSTANNLKDEEFNVNYSFEGASGYVIEETVSFGELSLEDMPVGIATHIGPYLVNQKYDGLLGLAFKGGNSSKSNTLPFVSSLLLVIKKT